MSDDARLAALTLSFMEKAAMAGADVPAYVECHNWLNELKEGARLTVAAYDEAPRPRPAPAPPAPSE